MHSRLGLFCLLLAALGLPWGRAENLRLEQDALLVADPQRPGRSTLAFLAAGTEVEPTGRVRDREWREVRLSGWIPAAAPGSEAPSRARALFALARAAGPAADGRVELQEVEARRVELARASRRGEAVRLQFQVVARNRSDFALQGLRLEFTLLDRKGRAITQATARLSSPETLLPGQEGTFDFPVLLNREQLQAYHKRRIRTRFFVE